MDQRDAEFFQALGGSELSPFAPDYRADHWAQGPERPAGGVDVGAGGTPSRNGYPDGSVRYTWPDGAFAEYDTSGRLTKTMGGASARAMGNINAMDQAVAALGGGGRARPERRREHERGREREPVRGRGGKTVTQTVVFSDGSFRTYYTDGTYSKGYRGQPYPPGPVTRDVATQPLGPRFSLAVLGTDAFRVDNITNERHLLGQLMPDGRVLVGSLLYHPRVDGTLEWVGPPAMGANPQADANLVALQAAVAREAHEAQKTAALAAAVERAETDKLARQHRQYQGRLPSGGGGGIGQIGSAPGMGWGVAPTPASMMPTTTALPQSIGMRPAYIIAASPQPSSPSLEEIAAVTAEAAYEGAETALAEAEFYAAPQATEVVLVQEFDVFGGDPTGGGLGFGYHDPRSE